MSGPTFSVIVPAFNASSTLAETVQSVVAQQWDDWELVIVDDGSTDGTAQIGHAFAEADGRIRVVEQSNQGTAGAYNTGVAASAGGFIVLCSADDLLLPPHLTVMNDLISSHPECDIFSCNGYRQYPDGHREPGYTLPEWLSERSLSLGDVLGCCFFSVGAAYRRRWFEAAGGYRLGVYGEDYDFWLRAMARGARHCYTPQLTVVHRVSDSQKSAIGERVLESDIRIISDLVRDHPLRPEDAIAAQQAIESRRERLASARGFARMASASRRFESVLQRVLGRKLGTAAVNGAHRVTWVVRPLRERLARRRAMRR